MAIKKNNVLTGIIGPLVLRVVNGQQIVTQRMLPGTMKQTGATKLSAGSFAMASTFTAEFKRALGFAAGSYTDADMHGRLTGVINRILNVCRANDPKFYHFNEDSFSALTGFNFNLKSTVEKQMPLKPQISIAPGLLAVSFSETVDKPLIRFPKYSFKCTITFMVTLFRLTDGLRINLSDQQQLIIINDKKAVSIDTLNFIIPDGCLCVATMYMEYATSGNTGWRILNDKNFNPCCILSAQVTSGVYQKNDDRVWTPMTRFDG